jgi:hypothetical protein
MQESLETSVPEGLVEATGVLFRNPKPHVRSVHGYFPSVVAFSDGRLGASVVIGEAFEAPNCHVVYFESHDRGFTWKRKSNVTSPVPDASSSTFGRLTLVSGSVLLATVTRHSREEDDHGITAEREFKMVPTKLECYWSRDSGASWEKSDVEAPFSDVGYEMCASCLVINEDLLLWPTSTSPLIGGPERPFLTGAIISQDGGKNWRSWTQTFSQDERIYWEAKIIKLPDERLLSVAWVHDAACNRDLENHYIIGTPDGASWTEPKTTRLRGQTLTPVVLDGGRVLCAYRRVDKPGLWLAVARIEGHGWNTESEFCLWSGQNGGLPNQTVRELCANLRFGAPSMIRLADGTIFLCFWNIEDNVSQITWFRVDPSKLR